MTNEKTWFKGDRCEYTGKSEIIYGKLFYEVKMLNGVDAGEMRWIVRGPENKAR